MKELILKFLFREPQMLFMYGLVAGVNMYRSTEYGLTEWPILLFFTSLIALVMGVAAGANIERYTRHYE